MPLRRILITEPIKMKSDFFAALGGIRQAADTPAPKNLDAMADFLREHQIDRIVCVDWQMNDRDSHSVKQVLEDLGVTLYL